MAARPNVRGIAFLAAIAVTCVAVALPGAVRGQGIDATKHDLTGGGVGEICVFCHTPHNANDAVQAPLWNKPASGASYQTYDSITMDGTVIAVGSVSIACLSCHDGTQSTDVVINAPGTAGVDPSGIALRGGNSFLDDPSKGDFIGTDLTDDHPIGMPYGGGVTDPASGLTKDPDFVTPSSGEINGTTRWWVDTNDGSGPGRDKQDMILYARNDGEAGQPYVECATCHDPHSDVNETFLRTSNDNSAACLACHVK